MKNSYSQAEAFIAQLKSIEQKINCNQLQEAAQQLNRLGKTVSHDPRLFLLGSRLAQAAQNPDGMLQAARKAHQLAPQWAAATLHLASVLASRDETEEAMDLTSQAVEQATTQAVIDVEVLTAAGTIAERLGQYPQALAWLRQAEKLSPAVASIRYKIGLTLGASGNYVGAIDVFTNLLDEQQGNPSLLSARLQAALRSKQLALALQDGETLMALDPDNAEYAFFLAIARGETPATQPAAMITDLFNRSAEQFDRQWVVQLQYKLPRDVAQMIEAWHPDRKGDVLDLGCGTGLLGACLGPIDGVLVGVDLAEQMIAQATRHNVYDSFHRVNLLDALQATPAALYHVITALDVLIYVGSLDDVIPNAHRILLPGGRFVFSCESDLSNMSDYSIQSTFRYTHHRGYVLRMLDYVGFKDVKMEECVLRYESGQPVQGFLVIARKEL